MAPKRVLKFPQSDHESSFVLVQVSSKGSKPLDLKLIGTEGEAPYVVSLRNDRVASLRVKNCPVSETEWQTILLSIFEQQPHPDLQASATVQSNSSISLTIRKQVQGITQRLGAITLTYEPDEAIELFEWCATAVDAVTQAKQSSSECESKARELQSSVDQLQSQLDELVAAKQEDEALLLQRSRDLLNEKKVKIREQQKIIAELEASSHAEEAIEEEIEEQDVKPTLGKKASKRKAEVVDNESPEQDVDMTAPDEDGGETTEATASDESDDDDDDDDDDAGESVKAPPRRRNITAPKPVKKEDVTPPKTRKDVTPPPRALPFQKKKVVRHESDSDDEL